MAEKYQVNGKDLTLYEKSGAKVKAAEVTAPLKLKQKISLWNGCAIIIGVIVGSGVFVSPKGILYHTGSPALSVALWLLCGIYALLGALCYAELGTTIPKSGGDYIYIYEAFGSLPAFLFLWIALVIVNPTSLAIIALTFAQYCLKPFFPDSEVPDEPVRIIAGCCILVLTFINCYNVRWSTRLQDALAFSKIFALSVIVLAAVIYLARGNTQYVTVESLTAKSNTSPVGLALAFYSGVFSFSGWNYLNFVTEELKEPNKNLPRAIYISLPIVTLVYILVNMAYYCALSSDDLLASDAVAVTFAERTMGFFAILIPIFVAAACVGSLNGIIFTCSRMFFAGARNGHLPQLLAMININRHTPMPSLIILGGTSLIMLIIDDVYVLINYLAFAETAIVTMAVAGLIKMRIMDKERKRPIKFNLAIPIIFFISCVYIIAVPFVSKPFELIVASGIIASGVPIYFIFVYWENKPNFLIRPWAAFTHFIQALLLCVPGEG